MILSTSFNVQNSFPNFTLSSPIIVGQGQVVRGISYGAYNNLSNAIINGFLVDAIVAPITIPINNSGYTIPSGKNLYITNLYCNNGQLSIDYNMILSTSFNTQNVFPNFTLSSPIIVGQGQVVRGLSYLSNGVSSNAIINGYLK
jgi:hypothetical protein